MLFKLCFAIFALVLYSFYMLGGWIAVFVFAVLIYFPYPKLKWVVPNAREVTISGTRPMSHEPMLYLYVGCSPMLYEFLHAAVFRQSLGSSYYVTPVMPDYYLLVPFVGTMLRIWGVRGTSSLRDLLHTGQSVALMASSQWEMVNNYVIDQSMPMVCDTTYVSRLVKSNGGTDTMAHKIFVLRPVERVTRYYRFFPRLQLWFAKNQLFNPMFVPVDASNVRAIELTIVSASSVNQAHIENATTHAVA
jgi:hypothetical protein